VMRRIVREAATQGRLHRSAMAVRADLNRAGGSVMARGSNGGVARTRRVAASASEAKQHEETERVKRGSGESGVNEVEI